MKTLAFDYGQKRVGMAISDALGMLARGLETLSELSEEAQFAAIAKVIEEEGVSQLVVGLPRNMDGSMGPAAEHCKAFSERLEQRFQLPCMLWDERLSTVQADRILRAGKNTAKQRRGKVDQMAARIILQSYLDFKARQRNTTEE